MSSEDFAVTPDFSEPGQGCDLTVGSIPRHLFFFALPMLAGSALQTGYSVVNAFWVGKLGTDAFTAVTETMFVFFVLMAAAIGLTMASGILVAQAYGAKDWVQLRRAVHNSIILTGTVSFVCLVIGYFSAEWLLRSMKVPPSVIPIAVSYFRIFIWTIPPLFGIFLIASFLRGVGDSKTPLYFQAVFLAATAVLDPILMFGWLGLPEMGLNGTAVATIITHFGAVIAICVYLHRKRHIVSPDWKRLRADFATSMLLLKIGIPTMIQQVIISVGMMVIIGLVNAFGEKSAAAYGAGMRIDQIAFLPAMTFGAAVSTLAGQNIGAKQYHRVKEVFRWGLILSCAMTLVAVIPAISVPASMLRFFSDDPVVIAIGSGYLRIVGLGYVLLSIWFVCNGVINGAGHTFIPTVISLIALWFIRIPIAAKLVRSTHRIEGIWYAVVISFAIGTILSLIYYFSGRWKHPMTKKPVAAQSVENAEPVGELLYNEITPINADGE